MHERLGDMDAPPNFEVGTRGDLAEPPDDMDETLGEMDKTLGDAVGNLGEGVGTLVHVSRRPGDVAETLCKRALPPNFEVRPLFIFTKPLCFETETKRLITKRRSLAPEQLDTPRFVVLNLPRPVPALITYAQSKVTAMTNNPNFPTPVPALSAVSAAITALQIAETTALSRVKGAIVVRNDKKAALVTLLQELKGYIQKAADADPENGAAIIQSAGLPVRKTAVRPPRVFSGKPGRVSGSVDVTAALAAKRSAYEWQYSTDSGKTWIEAPPSLRAKTTIFGLPVAASVQFRYRAVTKAGPSDWSQPIAVVVK